MACPLSTRRRPTCYRCDFPGGTREFKRISTSDRGREQTVGRISGDESVMTSPNTHEDIMNDLVADPASREIWDRSALGRAFAIEIIRFREENRLSQAALSRQIGVSQPVIARLESGEHDPTVATLRKFARKLGIRIRVDIVPDGKANPLRSNDDKSAESTVDREVDMLLHAVA